MKIRIKLEHFLTTFWTVSDPPSVTGINGGCFWQSVGYVYRVVKVFLETVYHRKFDRTIWGPSSRDIAIKIFFWLAVFLTIGWNENNWQKTKMWIVFKLKILQVMLNVMGILFLFHIITLLKFRYDEYWCLMLSKDFLGLKPNIPIVSTFITFYRFCCNFK